MDEGKSLTRREFEAVMRRATELALSESDSDSGALSEAELYRIAREVGVSERHVRLALSEVRAGEVGGGAIERLFGPEIVRASRVVPGTARQLAERIDRFMVAGRLLQPVRRGATILQYRPAVDWISQVARLASATSRRYYVASAKSVEVHLEAVEPDRTLVEFRVDPGTRSEAVWGGLLGGGTVGVAGGITAGIALTTIAPVVAAAAVGAVVGGGASTAIVWSTGKSHQKKVRDVRAEVEGILDHLEVEEPLEPPPPSWQQWVRRQFHGARKMFGEVELDELEDDLRF
jgi:hypothetical protein